MEVVKEALGTKMLKATGIVSSGSINEGEKYITDQGPIFLKKSSHPEAADMFESEYASLNALSKTNTVRVPKPLKVINSDDGSSYIALEFIDMKRLHTHAAKLGDQLADLHLHNEHVAKTGRSESKYVKKFGFDTPTYVGRLVVDNTWSDNWETFFVRNRLDSQIKRLQETENNKQLMEKWSQLQQKIPKFFENVDIKPSLIHGDLWGGNAMETENEPVIYDPGCVYAHHEFDIAMTRMFGGFGPKFYEAYHKKIPKSSNYMPRQKLYMLFHYLNHWNHFGSPYRSDTLSLMEELIHMKLSSDN